MTLPTTLPPPPPGAPPEPAPSPGGPGPTTVLVAGIVGLALLVALAARSTSPFGPARAGDADPAELLGAVAVAVGATVAAGLALVVGLHRFVLAGRPGAPGLRATVVRALPFVLVAAAVVALLAISWTPLEPTPGSEPPTTEPSPRDPTGSDPSPGRSSDPAEDRRWLDADDLRLAGAVRTGDLDGDGDLDLGVDLDGDGTIDALVEPGDGRGGADLDGGGSILVRCSGGRCQAAVDLDGDGELDQRVAIDRSLVGLGAVDRTLLRQRFGELGELLVDGRPSTPAADPADRGDREGQEDREVAEDRAGRDAERPDDDRDDSPIGDAVGRTLLLVLGLGVAAALGAALFLAVRSLRRRGHEGHDGDPSALAAEPDHEAAREQMAASLDDSIDAMVDDPDPRTAIIGAYARLLEGLAASDEARRPHEAPVEHLERVLGTLSVRPEPLRALIGLFEVARFSTHPLGEPDRARALDALRAAAADLAAARPAAPASEPVPS